MITRERVGAEIGLMKGRIKQKFANGKDNIATAGTAVSQGARRAVRQTDYYVHDNAWKMMGIVAGLAFAAGFLLSRANEEQYVITEGEPADPDAKVKAKKKGSGWEFAHAAIPLALLAWKTFQTSRCARRGTV